MEFEFYILNLYSFIIIREEISLSFYLISFGEHTQGFILALAK